LGEYKSGKGRIAFFLACRRHTLKIIEVGSWEEVVSKELNDAKSKQAVKLKATLYISN